MAIALSTGPSLRERNKRQVRERIVEAAMALMRERGAKAISADDIAARAGVGRATFFRYFESREAALSVGFYEKRLTALVEALAHAPPGLGPIDTLIWTFRKLEPAATAERDLLLLQGQALNASSSLRAKAVELQTGYEAALSNAVAPRFKRLRKDDPRPAILAAAVLAVVRAAVERWVAAGGEPDLARLVRRGLAELKTGFAGA
ncbi:MAG: TetR family transcriptional regulator [Nevskia sp.]|nr:TetR family transcriptional regulator [Nevskia sp.]